VSSSFKMRVPVYLDYDGRVMLVGNVPMVGSSTTNELKISLPKRPRRVFLNANYDILASHDPVALRRSGCHRRYRAEASSSSRTGLVHHSDRGSQCGGATKRTGENNQRWKGDPMESGSKRDIHGTFVDSPP